MKGLAVLLLAVVAASNAANQCPAEQETNWEIELLLPHADCDKFYKCTYGVPVEQNCYGDLLYNVDTEQCDWDFNVDCGDRNRPGEEPAPESEQEPEPESEQEEESEPEAEEAEPEAEESEPEAEEAEPEAEEAEPEAEEAEPEAEEEAEPEAEEEAEPEPEEAEPEQVEEAEPETEEEGSESNPEFLENGCPADPHIHWLFPSSEDCNVFYQCVWNVPVQRNCPETLHFNPSLQVCDYPQRAGCTV